MVKTTWIRMCGLYLLLFYFDQFVLTKPFFEDDQLYEGNRCQLENGSGEGVCTKATDCPAKLQQIQMGNYSRTGRCGFYNFDEIVCCPAVNRFEKFRDQLRPADSAYAKYKNMEPRIVKRAVIINGVNALEGEFSHMAALGYIASKEESKSGIKYICGGTLISEKHVLTAAHCVSNIQELVPVEVMLGTIDLTNPDKYSTQRIPISRIIKHPQYKRSLNYHDVAILEVQDSVEFTSYVEPMCLMTKPSSSVDPFLDILGWGAIALDGTTSTRLLKAVGLKFVDKNECSQSYTNIRAQIPNGLDDGMICVRDPDTTRNADTCWGDSGGPLLISSASPPVLAGVTSFGQACGGNVPGVYASVYKYLGWIEDQVWPSLN